MQTIVSNTLKVSATASTLLEDNQDNWQGDSLETLRINPQASRMVNSEERQVLRTLKLIKNESEQYNNFNKPIAA